jgi:hypothetical protein
VIVAADQVPGFAPAADLIDPTSQLPAPSPRTFLGVRHTVYRHVSTLFMPLVACERVPVVRSRVAIVVGLIFAIVTMGSTARVRGQDARPEDPRARTLLHALAEIGARHHVFFTVEATWADGEVANGFDAQLVGELARGESVDAELRALLLVVPRLTYQVSASNPSVVHVIDARLGRGSDYAMDSIVPKLDYAGTVRDLVSEIGRDGIPIASPTAHSSHELLFVDMRSRVSIRATSIPVRDALSNFVDLEGRGPILWIARTGPGEKQTTTVMFCGPAARPVEPPASEGPK